MTLKQAENLEFFQFDLFAGANLTHGLFTRKGGISPAPWHSLNLGGTTGDRRENVIENRRRIFDCVGRPVESIFDTWQVHGVHVIFPDAPRPLDGVHEKADIIITDRPELTLFMRFADCVPIMLYDPRKNVIGLVHAGWQGTVKLAARVAVEAMAQRYGCQPGDILAGIGPSIGPDDYEVGEDVAERFRHAFGEQAGRLIRCENGKMYLNLWEANSIVLRACGVHEIEVAGISTASDTTRWYSHRAENGATGRYGALIALGEVWGK